ncbi:MAG TPA: glycosyltransferase [Longimicrobiaceae bacterium]|nr:glycosyltransferase [Longimicrobiaceae bacterium]
MRTPPGGEGARPLPVTGPAVLHLDSGRAWAGGQNQVRVLMRGVRSRVRAQLCLCPRGSPLESRLREEGLPVAGIRWRGGADPRAVLAVARAMRGFDLVHCHDAHALQVALVPAKLLGIPLVASRRVPFRTSAAKWNRADRVIAVSEGVRAGLAASGVDPRRLRTIHSGIDPAEVRALPPLAPTLRERLGIAPDAFVVGNVGHLYEYKHQEELVRAAAEAPRDLHWVIVGEGPRRPVLEELLSALGLGDRVHLVGRVDDARRLLREFDLFAFSSRDEGLGSSVLDALAAGLPTVAADDSGPAEILRPVHASTGTSLYPPGDHRRLAELVRALRESGEARREMVRAQSSRLSDFHVDTTAERTLEVYRELRARS